MENYLFTGARDRTVLSPEWEEQCQMSHKSSSGHGRWPGQKKRHHMSSCGSYGQRELVLANRVVNRHLPDCPLFPPSLAAICQSMVGFMSTNYELVWEKNPKRKEENIPPKRCVWRRLGWPLTGFLRGVWMCQPANPWLGVRVWPGLDKPNPYPYPAVPGSCTWPGTATRDNP